MKIYFDLDGVLANFNKGVEEFCKMHAPNQGHESEEYEKQLWKRVSEYPNFYDHLDLIDGTKELLLDVYEKYGDNCQILSAAPSPKRNVITAKDDKVNWTKRMVSPLVTANIVLRKEKKDYCQGKDCILIDDYQKNIDEWSKVGGTGILFTTAEQVRRELEKMGIL